ncbi:hypothetical protein [Hymenobacter mucosus]|uniref:Uncharacterized protein n=1 Tax=Hymenobacter mucosus TaxID=1411120 RepID=A0A239ABL4_9BACT|nr:hypothetical protein [Hymenobacter mucosus]SNR92448.1 hypothetical protein SAMN06269173_11199 [Hymenobacter mucosus]
MSTKPSGYGLMQIGGQERPFHVGTHQSDIFCRLHNMSIKAYSEMFSPQNLQAQNLTAGDIADFVYSSLVAGAEWDGLRVELTPLHVRAWVDDAQTEETTKPIAEMLKQVVARAERDAERAGNAQAPPAAKRGSKAAKKKD